MVKVVLILGLFVSMDFQSNKTRQTKDNLSYDVAVFQWITSCHKNHMTARVITLLREYVTSLTTSVTTMLIFIENMSTLRAIKSYFKSHMIKRILHEWSFHMEFTGEFIKLAKGSFNKFHMK